ncbi:hypothetical protein GGF46_001826 [Coemansia sp. RSA 552]|nr:hypothetical protein GGF46_001826 [Coemansia sp. RSA 552]
MYIPASSTSLLQSRCSSVASTVTVERQDVAPRHPTLSLRLQSPGSCGLYLHRRKQAPPVYTPPAVVRKGSGEVVRPCLRRRSATTANTPCVERRPSPSVMRTPRFVHFGADLECVRWFLKAQSPKAVREDAVPDYCSASEDDSSSGSRHRRRRLQAEAQRTSTVRLTPLRRPTPSFAAFEESPVVVEQVELADSNRSSAALRGTIKVHNIAFEKVIAVRYSLDQWRTTHEVAATFGRTLAAGQQGSGRPGVDRFAFDLPLPASGLVSLPAVVALCVRYSVAGEEYWDNNDGANYIFKISLPAAPAIVDDDCDMIATRTLAQSPELRVPRRLSFGESRQQQQQGPVFAAPSAADTRRYMAQSAALFGPPSPDSSSSSSSVSSSGETSPTQPSSPELPLFHDMDWCGGSSPAASPPLASAYHHAFSVFSSVSGSPLVGFSPLAAGAGISRPTTAPGNQPVPAIPRTASPRTASPLAGPIRVGSPIRHAMFDADGTVRTGSPLAWSHATTSIMQC